MCTPRPTPVISSQLVERTGPLGTALTSDWMLLFGSSSARLTEFMAARTGNLETRLRYRTAPVLTRLPSGWTEIGASNRAANGSDPHDLALSAITNQMWIQFALASRGNGGFGEGFCGFQAVLRGEGAVVGVETIEVQPEVNSGTHRVVPVCPPIPALGLNAFMLAVNVYGTNGETLGYRPSWRTFDVDPTEPNGWTPLSSEKTTTVDEQHNFTTLSVSPGTKMFAQFGLQLGGASARATVHVVCAARYTA